jgi:hypothetical protein
MVKKANGKCPICGRPVLVSGCRVSADGRAGHCKSKKRIKLPGGKTRSEGGRWERKKVRAAELEPGPLQHKSIPEPLAGLVRGTFPLVGRYIQPTLEQWEVGFMRDVHIGREIRIWAVVAGAFLTFHRRRNLPLRADEEEKRLVGALLRAGETAEDDPEAKTIPDYDFLRECLADPAKPAEWADGLPGE